MARVLLVTEDARFISQVRSSLQPEVDLIACMGPAQRTCLMEMNGTCSLCKKADVAVVDSPVSGYFYDHYEGIPTLRYAEELAERHPDTQVILCDPVQHGDIPSAFMSRAEVLESIRTMRFDGREEQ